MATRPSQVAEQGVPAEGAPHTRKRATFLELLTLLAIGVVALAIVLHVVLPGWRVHGIPAWYDSYLRWQTRHGIYWLPF